jgi:hypothetical protein
LILDHIEQLERIECFEGMSKLVLHFNSAEFENSSFNEKILVGDKDWSCMHEGNSSQIVLEVISVNKQESNVFQIFGKPLSLSQAFEGLNLSLFNPTVHDTIHKQRAIVDNPILVTTEHEEEARRRKSEKIVHHLNKRNTLAVYEPSQGDIFIEGKKRKRIFLN